MSDALKGTDGLGLVSRRAMLGGSIALGAASAVPAFAAQPAQWDRETDIVCVGSGASGLTSAIFATARKKQVIVLEKMPFLGGTTAKSGGGHWIPNHFGLKAHGVEDRREDCLKYMARYVWPDRYAADAENYGIPRSSLALLEAFYDNGSKAVDELRALKAYRPMIWMMSRGKVPQTSPNRVPDSLAPAIPDYFDHVPENRVPRGRCLGCEDENGRSLMGSGMVAEFERWLVARNVPILTEHRVRNLTRDASGRVTGVIVEHGGKEIAIRARQGVIFGTGGYAHNRQLHERYHKTPIYGSCAAPGSTGDLIGIAGEAGAMLGNMTSIWGANVILEQAMNGKPQSNLGMVLPGDSMMFINRTGQRVVNEHRSYSSRARVHETFDPNEEIFPNKFLFMLFDERTRNRFAGGYPIPGAGENPSWLIKGATLEELSANLSTRLAQLAPRVGAFPLTDDFAAQLKKTVARFNGFARQGVDADLNRGGTSYDLAALTMAWANVTAPRPPADEPTGMPNPNLYPLAESGPYYAIIMARGALDTNGGPVVNENAQICDVHGAPIPGLYGAGNCIAAPTREAYLGAGGTIGPAMAFAYIAADHASKAS